VLPPLAVTPPAPVLPPEDPVLPPDDPVLPPEEPVVPPDEPVLPPELLPPVAWPPEPLVDPPLPEPPLGVELEQEAASKPRVKVSARGLRLRIGDEFSSKRKRGNPQRESPRFVRRGVAPRCGLA